MISPKYIIIAGVLFYLYQRAISLVDNIRFQFMGLNTADILKGISLFNTKLPLKIKVTNPTATPINISGFTGDLIYNGYSLGRIDMRQAIKLPANSQQDLQLDANIINMNVLGNLPNLIKNAKTNAFKVTGIIKTPLGEVPLPEQTLSIS